VGLVQIIFENTQKLKELDICPSQTSYRFFLNRFAALVDMYLEIGADDRTQQILAEYGTKDGIQLIVRIKSPSTKAPDIHSQRNI